MCTEQDGNGCTKETQHYNLISITLTTKMRDRLKQKHKRILNVSNYCCNIDIDVNCYYNDYSFFLWCVEKNKLDLIKYLISNKDNSDSSISRINFKATCDMYSVRKRNFKLSQQKEEVEKNVENKLDVNEKYRERYLTCLHVAIVRICENAPSQQYYYSFKQDSMKKW